MRTKLLLEVQYLGTRYCGWQPQPGVSGSISVYEVLKGALESEGFESGPVAAGRTDKGVHAMQQVVTLSVRRSKPVDTHAAHRTVELAMIRDGLNSRLPTDVRVLAAHDAPLSAHAMTGTEV